MAIERMLRLSIAFAAFFGLMCVFVAFAIPAELALRTSVVASRTPIYTEDSASAQLVYRTEETFVDAHLFSVLFVEPVQEGAEPPPGVATWMEPGRVVVSESALIYRDEVERQLGDIAGVIDSDYVLDGELIAYVRLQNPEGFIEMARGEDGVFFGSGFTGPDSKVFGFGLTGYEQWSRFLLPIALFMLITPTLVFIRIVRKDFRSAIRTEQCVLQRIGANREELVRHAVKCAWKPFAVGVAVAASTQLFLISGLIDLPITGFGLHFAAYKPIIWQLVLADIAICFVMLAYLTFPQTRLTSHRKTTSLHMSDIARIGAFICGVVLVSLALMLGHSIPDVLSVPMAVGSIVLVLIGLPAVINLIVMLIAKIWLRIGRDPLTGIFLRWVKENSDEASRPASLAGIYICLGVVIIGAFNLVAASREVPAVPDPPLQVVSTRMVCAQDDTGCLAHALRVIALAMPDAKVVVKGTEGVHEYSAGDPDAALSEIFVRSHLDGGQQKWLPNLPIGETRPEIYTISQSEDALLPLLQDLDMGTKIPALSMEFGEDDRALAAIYAQQITWLTLFTSVAFVIALAVTWVQFSRENSIQAREMASIVSLTGQTALVGRLIVKRTVAVNAVAGLASFTIGIFVSSQFRAVSGGHSSLEFLGVVLILYVAFLGCQALASRSAINASASSWLPGKESQ